MLLQEEFSSLFDSIKPALKDMILASQDLKNCKPLQEVLYLVLMVGNYLNSETKNKDPDLVKFPEQLVHLDEASKFSLETIKCDVRRLREKADRISQQVKNTTDQDILDRMGNFLNALKDELIKIECDFTELEKLRVELAEFFCEDVTSFKLEECFKIFHTFCVGFQKAAEENVQRKIQEEKEKLKKTQKEQKFFQEQAEKCKFETAKEKPLSMKYATLNSSRDTTLTTYMAAEHKETNSTEIGKTRTLVALLEQKRSTRNSGSQWYMVDTPSRRISRIKGCLSAGGDERDRCSTFPRAANLRHETNKLFSQEDEEDRENIHLKNKNMLSGKRFSLNINATSTAPGDEAEEHLRIIARTRLSQKENAPISSSVSCIPVSEHQHTSTSGADRDTVNQLRRRRTRGSQAEDLNELLNSLETENHLHQMSSRTRKYNWQQSSQTESPGGQQNFVTPKTTKTDIDDVVRHCEKAREEIDEIAYVEKSLWNSSNRSARDSGIDEGAVSHISSPEGTPNASDVVFAFTSSVGKRNAAPDNNVVDFQTETFTDKAETSCVLPLPSVAHVDQSSDSEQWRLVRDVNLEVDEQSNSEGSRSEGSVADKDEGFETESHSTVCSIDQLTIQENLKESHVHSNEVTMVESLFDKDAQFPTKKHQPSYLAGTKSSLAKGTSGNYSTKTIDQNRSLLRKMTTSISTSPKEKLSESSSKTSASEKIPNPRTTSTKTRLRSKAETNGSIAKYVATSSSSSTPSPAVRSLPTSPVTTNSTRRNLPQQKQSNQKEMLSRKPSPPSNQLQKRQERLIPPQKRNELIRPRVQNGKNLTPNNSHDARPELKSGDVEKASKPLASVSTATNKTWERLLSPPKSRLNPPGRNDSKTRAQVIATSATRTNRPHMASPTGKVTSPAKMNGASTTSTELSLNKRAPTVNPSNRKTIKHMWR